MAQTSINIRTDENLKRQFDEVCGELGLNLSAAFNIFMRTVVREREIPFKLSAVSNLPAPPFMVNTKEELYAKLEKGMASMKSGKGQPIGEVRAEMEKEFGFERI